MSEIDYEKLAIEVWRDTINLTENGQRRRQRDCQETLRLFLEHPTLLDETMAGLGYYKITSKQKKAMLDGFVLKETCGQSPVCFSEEHLKKLDDEINDLQSKLAEAEKDCLYLNEKYNKEWVSRCNLQAKLAQAEERVRILEKRAKFGDEVLKIMDAWGKDVSESALAKGKE